MLFLHKNKVIIRDLKPENIFLNNKGYIVLTNFNFVKILKNENSKTKTITGSPEFLAPEIVEKKSYDKAVDFWSLGILIYELNFGISPFYD